MLGEKDVCYHCWIGGGLGEVVSPELADHFENVGSGWCINPAFD